MRDGVGPERKRLEGHIVGLRQLIIDGWSWLNYKPVTDPERPAYRHAFPELVTGWVPEVDMRRLTAYKVLAAYDNNQAGQLATFSNDEHGLQRRELGDPANLIDAALGYLLGSGQTIMVEGAEHDDNGNLTPEATRALDIQDRLRDWAKKELLPLRMQQCERCAVRSGDGVYVLSWEPDKGRCTIRTYDPGFFFPEWEDDDQDSMAFPRRVHFAWELPEDKAAGKKARVRRITYELGPIEAATQNARTTDGRAVRETVIGVDGEPVLTEGDQWDDQAGTITRVYPWAPGKPSTQTCYLTDAEWDLEDLKAHHDVYNLPADRATYRVRADGETLNGLDLRLDFLPVTHIPNTIPDVGEYYGKSILATVLQLLDELSATDTDSSSASATTGSPVISLAGARLPVNRVTGQPESVRVEAGTVWQLADGGRMDALDTSNQLAELRARVDHLLDRLASNSRLTTAGLGTLDPGDVPSGYTLQLALGPLDALVASMRLAREHKYELLLRMVQRIHQAGHAWPAGESVPARLVWGPHTPTDRATILDEVTKGYQAKVFSLETCTRMLQNAGYPIADINVEIARIQARAFEDASTLADATGDNAAVRTYLGLPEADSGIPGVSLIDPDDEDDEDDEGLPNAA
jgi:hypothetical protein